MIKPASFKDELFVVLTLQGQVKNTARRLQKVIADHYDLFATEEYPQLHITIDRIKKNKVSQAREIILKIVQNSPPVKVKINNLDCLEASENNRFLVLDVEKTDSLLTLAYKLHKELSNKGISTISNYDDWKFHITIVNNLFSNNPIPEDDFRDLCLFIEGADTSSSSLADRIEIWRPVLDPLSKTLESIKLANGSEDD
mgnify:CR=1 FL=1